MHPITIVDRNRVFAVAQHECGHYIAARALGFQPGKLAITMLVPYGHRGESEQTLHRSLQEDEILDFLEKRAQVLCAGVIAEATSPTGVYDNDAAVKLLREGGGADRDYAKYKEIIYLMRNIMHGDTTDETEIKEQLDGIDNTIWNKSAERVATEYRHIDGLARRLASEVKQFNVKAGLTRSELANLPALAQRFGS
jgi:hypothetical protein